MTKYNTIGAVSLARMKRGRRGSGRVSAADSAAMNSLTALHSGRVRKVRWANQHGGSLTSVRIMSPTTPPPETPHPVSRRVKILNPFELHTELIPVFAQLMGPGVYRTTNDVIGNLPPLADSDRRYAALQIPENFDLKILEDLVRMALYLKINATRLHALFPGKVASLERIRRVIRVTTKVHLMVIKQRERDPRRQVLVDYLARGLLQTRTWNDVAN